MIKVGPAIQFSVLGKRENNEDFACFENGSHFVVCDGVGGNQKGEVASAIVARHFLNAFHVDPDSGVDAVLKSAEGKMSAHIQQNPETHGMATTLTFSQVRLNSILLGWVGDSRIYQFRNGRILFQTEDHSWVNEALKAGIITKKEAVGHPKSNIITRAIQGADKPTQAETTQLSDISKGDYFLHCSDGVLESWSNEDLEILFSQGFSAIEIIARMEKECGQKSRDNSTAILYEVVFADVPKGSDRIDLSYPGRGQVAGNDGSKKDEKQELRTSRWLLLITGLALLLSAGYYFYPLFKKQDKLVKPKVANHNKQSKNKSHPQDSTAKQLPGKPPHGAPLKLKNDSISDGWKKNPEEKRTGKDSTLLHKESISPNRNLNHTLPGYKPKAETVKYPIKQIEI